MAIDRKLRVLCTRIEQAEEAMQAELQRQFPMGRSVRCWLMHGQVTASTGIVIGHRGGRYAYVTVKLNSRARIARDVPASNVRLEAEIKEP